MLNAADDALRFVDNRSVDDVKNDAMLLRALVNCLTEIGEAAARLDEATRISIPNVPWNQVVGLRHFLVHVYWGVNAARLWQTVTTSLPPFAAALREWLSKSDEK